MKANLIDLNKILYEQIERLNDDSLNGQELEEQLKKTREIHKVASAIIDNTSLILEGAKCMNNDVLMGSANVLKAIGFDDKDI